MSEDAVCNEAVFKRLRSIQLTFGILLIDALIIACIIPLAEHNAGRKRGIQGSVSEYIKSGITIEFDKIESISASAESSTILKDSAKRGWDTALTAIKGTEYVLKFLFLENLIIACVCGLFAFEIQRIKKALVES